MPDQEYSPPVSPLISEFLYREKPKIDFPRLNEAVRLHCGSFDDKNAPTESGDVAHYVMLEALAEFKEGLLPTQLCLFTPKEAANEAQLELSLRQTWRWSEARKVATACPHVLIINDLMASTLTPSVRNKQFLGFMRALQETVPAQAIHYKNIQLVINPEDFLREQDSHDAGVRMLSSINVRLFRIEGSEGECLMDTLGMTALGLPDIQCHFRELDCNSMGRKLFDTALYLVEKGDMIQQGETVTGLEPDDHWKCQHEMALLGPERVVLDLNPGAPFAAGGRK